MSNDIVRLYYTGRGYFPGVPRRDLTDADLKRLGEARIADVTAQHPASGHASYQTTKPASRVPGTGDEAAATANDDVTTMTVAQLRALAAARNVTVPSKAKKADLIAALNSESVSDTAVAETDEGAAIAPVETNDAGDEQTDDEGNQASE